MDWVRNLLPSLSLDARRLLLRPLRGRQRSFKIKAAQSCGVIRLCNLPVVGTGTFNLTTLANGPGINPVLQLFFVILVGPEGSTLKHFQIDSCFVHAACNHKGSAQSPYQVLIPLTPTELLDLVDLPPELNYEMVDTIRHKNLSCIQYQPFQVRSCAKPQPPSACTSRPSA